MSKRNYINLRMKLSLLLFASCLSLLTANRQAQAEPTVSPTGRKNFSLGTVARLTLENHFSTHPKSANQLVKSITVPPGLKKELLSKNHGLFVTLSKNGQTRACWGNLTGLYKNDLEATVYTTELALTKEYRHPPVQAREVEELKAQVTIIESVIPVMAKGKVPGSLQPLVDGLMARSGGKSGILLPGEAKDPYYQVMQCKLKAGITPNEPCQLYRIKAHVIR